jgi:hypothetical protein
MNGRPGSQGTLEHRRGLGTSVWVWYLTTGAVLAATRVALWVWVLHQHAKDIYTETNIFIVQWLYPELVVGIFWSSLASSDRTMWAWYPLFTIGSFLMATPILLVGWLRNRRTTPPPSR